MNNRSSIIEDVKKSINLSDRNVINSELKEIFSCIDNTTLNGTDTFSTVTEFCENTKKLVVRDGDITRHVASVCVFPSFVSAAVKAMQNSGIAVASVAGGFPSGQTPLNVKMEEVRTAVGNGANEIDFVINRGLFLGGGLTQFADEISAVKAICGENAKLKVILETGELGSMENIYSASILALSAGADIIKTSTGKIAVGATPEAACAILDALSDFSEKSKKNIGIKVSGGVSDISSALLYYRITKKIFDKKTLDKQQFRIGTSSLTNQLFSFLTQ